MTDFTKYGDKHLWQTIRHNKKFQAAMERGASMEELTAIIDKLGVKYTEAQIEYIKTTKFSNINLRRL